MLFITRTESTNTKQNHRATTESRNKHSLKMLKGESIPFYVTEVILEALSSALIQT